MFCSSVDDLREKITKLSQKLAQAKTSEQRDPIVEKLTTFKGIAALAQEIKQMSCLPLAQRQADLQRALTAETFDDVKELRDAIADLHRLQPRDAEHTKSIQARLAHLNAIEELARDFPAHWDPKLRIPRGQVVAAASIVSPKY